MIACIDVYLCVEQSGITTKCNDRLLVIVILSSYLLRKQRPTSEPNQMTPPFITSTHQIYTPILRYGHITTTITRKIRPYHNNHTRSVSFNSHASFVFSLPYRNEKKCQLASGFVRCVEAWGQWDLVGWPLVLVNPRCLLSSPRWRYF